MSSLFVKKKSWSKIKIVVTHIVITTSENEDLTYFYENDIEIFHALEQILYALKFFKKVRDNIDFISIYIIIKKWISFSLKCTVVQIKNETRLFISIQIIV